MYENKSNKEISDDIAALESKISRVKREAGRNLNSSQKSWVEDSQALLNELTHELQSRPVNGPLTVPGIGATAGNLLNSGSNGPFANLGEQLLAVRNAERPGGRIDERLFSIQNAATGLGESTPSEGGFLIQQDFSNTLLGDVFSTGIVAKLCQRIPISGNANSIILNAFDETSRASTRFGGILAYWIDEAAEENGQQTNISPDGA